MPRLVIGVIFAACAIFALPALGQGKTNIYKIAFVVQKKSVKRKS